MAGLAFEQSRAAGWWRPVNEVCAAPTGSPALQLACNRILTPLASRCARKGVRHVPVNPAFTLVLGEPNYAGVHGVSVDQGAGCVIARAALGFSCRLRPALAGALKGAKRPSRTARKTGRHTHQRRRAAKAMGKRRSTWDPGGLCQRRHSAPTWGPQARARERFSHLPLAHLATRLMGRPVRQVALLPMRRYGGDNPVAYAWANTLPHWPTLANLGGNGPWGTCSRRPGSWPHGSDTGHD